MRITLDDYRCKLINKILSASSQQEAERFVDTALKSLQQNKINGYVIARFVEKAIKNLEEFKSVDHNTQQWTNIHYSLPHFCTVQGRAKPVKDL